MRGSRGQRSGWSWRSSAVTSDVPCCWPRMRRVRQLASIACSSCVRGPRVAQQPAHAVCGVLAVAGGDALGVGVVIVDGNDVGGGGLPAVVADDGAAGVERLGQVVECLDEVALGGTLR